MAKKLTLPRVHVMVICDEIEASANDEEVFDLTGVRTRICVDKFPHTHPQLCVYLQLTGHAGKTRCRVEVMRAETDEVVHATKSRKIELLGPLVVIPVGSWLVNCSFPAPGLYYVQAVCDE